MGLRKQAHSTSASTIEYAPRVQIGEILNEALDLYQRFFWRFVATAAVVFVGLDLIGALGATAGSDSGRVLWTLIGIVLSIVGTFWVQGALTEAVNDVRDGRIDTTIGELYARTRPRLPALIVAGILAAIGIGIGFILLIVPGLYLLTRWSLITPADRAGGTQRRRVVHPLERAHGRAPLEGVRRHHRDAADLRDRRLHRRRDPAGAPARLPEGRGSGI